MRDLSSMLYIIIYIYIDIDVGYYIVVIVTLTLTPLGRAIRGFFFNKKHILLY